MKPATCPWKPVFRFLILTNKYELSTQRRLWSDWADAQADLSLRLAHTRFVGFVMTRLIWKNYLHQYSKSCLSDHLYEASNLSLEAGLQKTDFLPVQTDFKFVKPIQFA